MEPIDAPKTSNQKIVYPNLQGKRRKSLTKFNLIRTLAIKKVFRKGDTTNWSNNLCTTIQILHNAIHSYEVNYLLET